MSYNKFIRLKKPFIKAEKLKDTVTETELPKSEDAYILVEKPSADIRLKDYLTVKTGEVVHNNNLPFFVSPFTGRLNQITELQGYLNRPLTKLGFRLSSEESYDPTLGDLVASGNKGELVKTLSYLPGMKPLGYSREQERFETIIIAAYEEDPFVPLNQYLLKHFSEEITQAAIFLRSMAERAILALDDNTQDLRFSGFDAVYVQGGYPNTIPELVIKQITGMEILKEEQLQKEGITFFQLNQVLLLGRILKNGPHALNTTLYIKGDGKENIVTARIGTPIKFIFENLGINSYNSVIANGLLRGQSIYDLDTPVSVNVRSIIAEYIMQKKDSDENCINCGECVRICPAKVPVNLLIRYLKNKRYDDAISLCDLNSCIECGMCSFVCVSKIPIFHYIMLGKYETSLTQAQEG